MFRHRHLSAEAITFLSDKHPQRRHLWLLHPRLQQSLRRLFLRNKRMQRRLNWFRR